MMDRIGLPTKEISHLYFWEKILKKKKKSITVIITTFDYQQQMIVRVKVQTVYLCATNQLDSVALVH